MATFTSFLNLRKPSAADNVNVTLDLSDNFEEIDGAISSLDTRIDAIETGPHYFDTAAINWSTTPIGSWANVLEFGAVPPGKYSFFSVCPTNYSVADNPNCVYRLINITDDVELARTDFTLVSGLTFTPVPLVTSFTLSGGTKILRTQLSAATNNGTKLTQTVRGILIPCGNILGS